MTISPKKLIKMARTWRKMAALSRRSRISFPRLITNTTNYDKVYAIIESCTTTSSSVVDKGHFVVYTADERRFVMPLAYLKHNILRELFKMSEEEFGLSRDGPIMLPCDAMLMEYAVTLVRRGVPTDLEKALLRSMDNTCGCSFVSSSNFQQGVLNAGQQLLVCGC